MPRDITFDTLDIGSVLCDTHDGINSPDPSIWITDMISMTASGGSEIITKLLSGMGCDDSYHNKMLVIVGYCPASSAFVAAWSYDDRVLGFAKIKRAKVG